jgi:hypothetical protein
MLFPSFAALRRRSRPFLVGAGGLRRRRPLPSWFRVPYPYAFPGGAHDLALHCLREPVVDSGDPVHICQRWALLHSMCALLVRHKKVL